MHGVHLSRHPSQCPAHTTHSLELLEPDIWQLQHRRLSSVSTMAAPRTHLRSSASSQLPSAVASVGVATSTLPRREPREHADIADPNQDSYSKDSRDPRDFREHREHREVGVGPRHSRHQHPHHAGDNPYYQPRSADLSEYNVTPR